MYIKQADHVFSSIRISGVDAENFLQGQLTCDVSLLTHRPELAAYCDHKGRMLANFWIQRTAHDFRLFLPAVLQEKVLLQLKKFALFSKVIIEPDTCPQDIETDRYTLIKKGIVFLYPETSLLFTPAMIDWDKHGGVSFTKGCYVGQEIVARTHYLGKLKRHLQYFTIDTQNVIGIGSALLNEGNNEVGTVCEAMTQDNLTHGLAVIEDAALPDKIFSLSSNGAMEIKLHRE